MDPFITPPAVARKKPHARWLSATLLFSFLSLFFATSYGQTTVIGPLVGNGNFEDATNTAWQIVNGTETNRWVISTGATAGFSGSKCAYVSDNASSPFAHNYTSSSAASTVHLYQDVTLPAALPIISLSFKVINYGENGWDKVAVYISNGAPSTAPVAGTPASGYAANNMPPIAGYTELGGYAINGSWTNVNVAITPAQAGNSTVSSQRRILFVWTNDGSVGTQPPGGIDDVLLTAACSGPQGLNATAITTNTATLNWTALVGATGYNVRYKKVSDPVTVATWVTPTTVAAGVTSLAISGLTALSTQYEFQVSATGPVCNNFNPSATFFTVCGYATLPYSETFETSTGPTDLPGCMAATSTAIYSGIQIMSSPSSPAGGSNHTPGGSKYAGFFYSNTNTLFTPAINVQAGKMYQLTLWYQNTAGNVSFDSLVVAYGTSQTPAGMSTNIASIIQPAIATGTYTQFVTTFVATTTATIYVGFKVASSNYNTYSFFSIDDIGIIELPPCTGTPTAGTIVTDPAFPCLGKTARLSLSGSSQQSGLAYQWQSYSRVTNTWNNIAGAISNNYTTPPISDSIQYRVTITCTNPGGLSVTSAAFTVNPYSITLPYLETFEGITANNQLPSCWAATNLGSLTYTYTTAQGSGKSNHTPGGSKYASFRYYGNDWFFTPGVNLDTGKTYQFTYWYVTDGVLGWNYIRAAYGTAQNAGAMINTISTVTSPVNTTYAFAKSKFSVSAPGTYNLGLSVTSTFSPNYMSVDDIGLVELPPCSGTPTLVMGQADTITLCPDTTAFVTLTGSAGDFSGFVYKWDSSVNGTAWFPIVGATTEEHTAYSSSVYPTIYYRVRVTCAASGLSDSKIVTLKVRNPSYAPLPYFNGFETWANSCATTDVPSDGNWKQYWYTGNASWRRDDQGASANWQSPTSYGYTPVAQSGARSARFHSGAALGNSPSFGYGEGQLDMYLNCAGNNGSKGLYFYMMNKYSSYKNDSLTIWYSVDGGLVFSQIDGWDTATNWTRRIVNIPSNSPATIVSFRARKFGSYDNTDIGLDSVYVALPCTGTPVAGNITLNGLAAVCAGSSVSFNLTGTSMAGNLLIQWEASTTGSTTGFGSISVPGSVYSFTTPAVTNNTWYRAKVTCGGSGLFTYSNVIAVTTTSPAVYATLPYVEDFESWSTRCSPSDIPSVNWTNTPSIGNNSWRRFDQGSTANWSSINNGLFFPNAAIGSYSARFHNYANPNGVKGQMDLYVNCSAPGNKELRYYINMSNRSTYLPVDYTRVSYSIDGGVTFSILTTITTTNGWEQKVHVMPSTSATTLVRFESSANQYVQDIAIDYIEVLPACSAQPVAGVIDSVRPCPGTTFRLKATGTSVVGGLTYQWQSTTSATATGFANVIPGGTSAQLSTSITQATWYRLIVTCAGSVLSDTTAPFRAQTGSFYNCYCLGLPYYPYTASTTLRENIGNVTVEAQPTGTVLLNNGVALPLINNTTSANPQNPGYTSYTNLPAIPVYHDSAYRMTVKQVSASTSNGVSAVAAWVDYDQDGTFDQNTERVFLTSTSFVSGEWRGIGNFTVPPTAKVGVTAMRVILAYGSGATVPNVCGIYNNFTYGETEDYLVEVRYNPCGTATVNAGIASVSDTATCPGYKVTLIDTSYEKLRYGLTRQWQQSTNGGASWTNVGPQNRDTIKALVTGPMQYRYSLSCGPSGVSSYSNVLKVKINEAYQCYCASYADGGPSEKLDSSDVGSFSIGNYTFQVGGPHLVNPAAFRDRTDYTEDVNNVIELFADSTYKVDIYHIMKGRLHKDAKVTLFMDFDNDFVYSPSPVGSNYPSELVLTAFTSAQEYYLDNLLITIPKGFVIPNKLTGMRLVLNENVSANNASDMGCGPYTSGETEDFAVIFRDASAPQGVNGVTGNVKVVSLYPNPTSGVAMLSYTSDVSVKDLEITITSTTGQVISKKSYSNAGKQFTTEVNLADQARGIYFVEIKADGDRIVRKLVTQ